MSGDLAVVSLFWLLFMTALSLGFVICTFGSLKRVILFRLGDSWEERAVSVVVWLYLTLPTTLLCFYLWGDYGQ